MIDRHIFVKIPLCKHTSNCCWNPVLLVLGFTEDNPLTISLTLSIGATIEVVPQVMCSDKARWIKLYWDYHTKLVYNY